MALEVVAFSHVEYVSGHPAIDEDEGCQADDHWEVPEKDDFPSHHKDLKPGCYQNTAATEGVSFFMGGSEFNWWRDQLSYSALGVSAPTVQDDDDGKFLGKPFVELIDFTDSYGTIGPAICAKLARDFADHEKDARKYADERLVPNMYFDDVERFREAFPEAFIFPSKRWFDLYLEFKQVFLLGSQGGMVMFRYRDCKLCLAGLYQKLSKSKSMVRFGQLFVVARHS